MAIVSGYQKFRGNPENKLFYILDNFIGGINTEFTDDSSANTDFERIINLDTDRLGALHKRQGFGELTALSNILNLLGSNKLPVVKNRTETTPNPEEDNDNIVYMKLLQNDNNCFRNLAGFSGKYGYRDYQKMYGFQNNTFKLLILTTSILNKTATTSYAWYYKCTLPTYVLALAKTSDNTYIKDIDYYAVSATTDTIYQANKTYFKAEGTGYTALIENKDYGAGETITETLYEYRLLTPEVDYNYGDSITTDTYEIKDNIVVEGYKFQLPVIFTWDRNLLNIKNIEYYDKIYFTENNKGLVCFDRNYEINSDEALGKAFTYAGFAVNNINGAYKPTAFEISTYGFNLLGGDNPVNYVDDSSLTSDSIQGCAIFNKDFKPTYNVIPSSQDFKIGIYYTGSHSDFALEFKSVESQTTYKAEEVKVTPDTTNSRAGFKVYDVVFSSFPNGEVEVKITMTGSSISPYYDYFKVGSVDNETLTNIKGINVGECKVIFINDRAVYYKKDTIYFSQINDFTYVPSKNYITLPLSSTDEITRICYFEKSYIIFTKEQIHKITGNYSESSTDFKRELVNESIGCHAGNTVVPIDNTLYFASQRGLYALKSNKFVEGYENVKELDLKVKRLTSDYTLYAEERDKPAIRYNGINEHAYALRYKDKYLLFYNNYGDKGDYASQNELDVLCYQYELGAYTTYRFKEKPTFLFLVDNAIETFSTVKAKEEFTDSKSIVDYDFTKGLTSDQIPDKSGNGNNGIPSSGTALNKGIGVSLDGETSYGDIPDFNGELTNGFTLGMSFKANKLNGGALIDLEQESSSVYSQVTNGEIVTNTLDGFRVKFTYSSTPNPETGKDTVSYSITIVGDHPKANSGEIVVNVKNSANTVLASCVEHFDLVDNSKLLKSGVFTIDRTNGTYSDTWRIESTVAYVITTSYREKGSQNSDLEGYYAPTTTNNWGTKINWIQLGFTGFRVYPTDTGCRIDYTPAIKVTSGLYTYHNHKMVVTIDGTDHVHCAPTISHSSGTKIYSCIEGVTSEEPGVTYPGGSSVYLSYNGDSRVINVYLRYYCKFTRKSTGEYIDSVATGALQSNIPTSKTVYNTTRYSVNPYGSNNLSFQGYGAASFRQIITKTTTNNELMFIMNSEFGEKSITIPDADLLNKHDWEFRIIRSGNDYNFEAYKDGYIAKTDTIPSNIVKTSSRTVNLLGALRGYTDKFSGDIYNLYISNPSEQLLNYTFSEGKGNVAIDSSAYSRNCALSNTTWIVVTGASISGTAGYITLPKLDSSVMFSNGFKIEFSGKINAKNGIIRVIDLAKSYNTETSPIKFNSINVVFKNDLMAFNSTGENGRTYRVEARGIDTSVFHNYVVDCVDNGNGYDISISVDNTVLAKSFFNYGGITNVTRSSNLIGKSNNSTETAVPDMVLENLKLTIYGNESGIPIYKSSIYEFDTTPKDFGRPIYIDVKTKAVNLEYPQHIKKLKHTFIKLIGGDTYSELFFELYSDGYLINDPVKYTVLVDENGTITLDYNDKEKNLQIDGKLSLLGSLVLDKTKLGTGTYQTIKMVSPTKGKNFSIRIYGDSNEFLTLDSFGLVCKLGKVKQG